MEPSSWEFNASSHNGTRILDCVHLISISTDLNRTVSLTFWNLLLQSWTSNRRASEPRTRAAQTLHPRSLLLAGSVVGAHLQPCVVMDRAAPAVSKTASRVPCSPKLRRYWSHWASACARTWQAADLSGSLVAGRQGMLPAGACAPPPGSEVPRTLKSG